MRNIFIFLYRCIEDDIASLWMPIFRVVSLVMGNAICIHTNFFLILILKIRANMCE